jgi:serine/threonine-protein kinase
VETLKIALEPSELRFDTFVPTELANICRRAMARDPMARFESAKAFRDAITGYLRHREALELHELTMKKLAELERGAGDDRLFTECRFGFELVRRAWPEFEPARVGLRRTLVLMVRRELERKAPRVARALLSELEQPPVELVMQVEDAERAEREAAERLAKLENHVKEQSTDAARDPKSVYTRGLAIVLIGTSLGAQALESTGLHHFTTTDGLVFGGLLLMNAVVYTGWLRRQADANQLQRRMSFALGGLATLTTFGWVLAVRGEMNFPTALSTFFLINAAGWWTAAVTIEPRGATVAVGCAISAVIGLLFPQYATGGGAVVGVAMWMLANLLRTPERSVDAS